MRVLYLAGSGRSGSTLIANVLGQLDGAFAAGELRYLWRRGMLENRPCGCGEPFRDCPVWTEVLSRLGAAAPTGATDPAGTAAPAGIADPAGIARRLRGRLRLRGLVGMLWRQRRGRAAVPPHPDDDALAALYRAVAARPGVEVIIDSSKLPPYGALLAGLPGVDLRVLHVVRDPRAAAFSWRRRRGLDGPGDRELMSRPPVAKAALLWLAWNAATRLLWAGGLRAGGRWAGGRWAGDPARYLRIRYEDFVADPAAETRRIAAFAGLDGGTWPFRGPDAVDLAATHSVAGNPSRHRTGPVRITADAEWAGALSRTSYTVVTALTAPLLRTSGYLMAGGRAAAGPDTRPVGKG
jgi:hypothetical protein